ncbi:hypothetical protein LTR70_007648 [Exophiala xenobiotica]|uniref:Uncharacterized protein n=1 Tax=Lithohypha guttulata TaxID=1690604 RepID=A0ABR0K227_9EURO|nr:hypothetical protein LTR24_007917 [Lithohypha guttulata]KAK5313344.1 hypothetical protein LTR70_007648 [Exophiala xenobiotica]
MSNNTLPLVTTALIIFAVLFVVSGLLVTFCQYLRYHYRAKLNDAEKGRTNSKPTPEEPPRRQPRDRTSGRPQPPTISHTPGWGMNRKYDTKPLPLRPPTPGPTASAAPRRVGPNSVRFGLGVYSDLRAPPPNPPTVEQSYFSSDEEEDNDGKQEDEKDIRGVKRWFPPKPSQSRASRLPSPLQDAKTRRVSSQRPQVAKSALRLSQRVSQLHWPQPRKHIETADVPIVSTPHDLRIDPLPLPTASRMLGSPFHYRARQSADKRETVIGPGEPQRRVSGEPLEPSREPLAPQDSEQSNVI